MTGVSNVIAAFSEEHVERLTGLSKSQLRYWDRTDFFRPSLAAENRRVPFSRIYSFKDLVSVRTLSVLRKQFGVALQHLRKVAAELAHLSDDKGTAITLYVLNRRVVFLEPNSQKYREIVGQQYVLGLPLHAVVSETKRDMEILRKRDDAEIGRVEQRRNVQHNALVLAGTRIPVSAVRRYIEDVYTTEQILGDYPTLSASDIEAMRNQMAGKAA